MFPGKQVLVKSADSQPTVYEIKVEEIAAGGQNVTAIDGWVAADRDIGGDDEEDVGGGEEVLTTEEEVTTDGEDLETVENAIEAGGE